MEPDQPIQSPPQPLFSPDKTSPVFSSSPPPSHSKQAALLGLIGVIIILVAAVIAHYLLSSNKTPSTLSATSTSAQATANPATVNITNSAFVPATSVVQVNQAVIWTNTDSMAHSIAADASNTLPGFSSNQNLAENDSYSYVFDKVGTFTYHDGVNPYGFTGTVVVKP